MKSILLPVEQNEHMPSALETSRLAASLFDAEVEAVALCPAVTETVSDPMVAAVIPERGRLHQKGVMVVPITMRRSIRGPKEAAGFYWRAASLGNLARVHDLTVLNRPGARGRRLATLETVLFESGRPILVAPPSPRFYNSARPLGYVRVLRGPRVPVASSPTGGSHRNPSAISDRIGLAGLYRSSFS